RAGGLRHRQQYLPEWHVAAVHVLHGITELTGDLEFRGGVERPHLDLVDCRVVARDLRRAGVGQ
ncbi:MAG TPA: hypothetical protein VMV09_03370, partial [Candidatus Saccharimonadales bacterium]|nr:hypothetical protein [Candidatus Saccharimonadales bacterium]